MALLTMWCPTRSPSWSADWPSSTCSPRSSRSLASSFLGKQQRRGRACVVPSRRKTEQEGSHRTAKAASPHGLLRQWAREQYSRLDHTNRDDRPHIVDCRDHNLPEPL